MNIDKQLCSTVQHNIHNSIPLKLDLQVNMYTVVGDGGMAMPCIRDYVQGKQDYRSNIITNTHTYVASLSIK